MKLQDGWKAETRVHFVQVLVPAILNGDVPKELLAHFAEFGKENRIGRERAGTVLQSTFRGLMDQWIDSGKTKNGENAWDRNIRWRSPLFPKSISVRLAEYEFRYPPRAHLREDGRYEILMVPEFARVPDPVVRARDCAVYQFVTFLDSPDRERLFRCEFCKRYYSRERSPRKGASIAHGTYCSSCQAKGAYRRTDSTRKWRHRRMICWAAECLPMWTKRKGPKPEWVSEQVNKHIVRQPVSWQTISRNWVTRHLKEIEASMEGRNAKS
jgi:hypothetical protein